MDKTIKTIQVFFDGACPLCQREVKRYQKLIDAQQSAADAGCQTEKIDWKDISKSTLALQTEFINYDDAMRLIHIKDGSGIHQVGLEAVLTLWDKIPYYRRVSTLIRKLPLSHPFLAKAYELLAKYRISVNKFLEAIKIVSRTSK